MSNIVKNSKKLLKLVKKGQKQLNMVKNGQDCKLSVLSVLFVLSVLSVLFVLFVLAVLSVLSYILLLQSVYYSTSVADMFVISSPSPKLIQSNPTDGRYRQIHNIPTKAVWS